MMLWRMPSTDYVVVKVHAYGVEWWEAQDMPPTTTIGCRSLEFPPYLGRPLVGDNAGRHYVYRVGCEVPSVEIDSYLDTHTPWTRIPPSPTKFWIDTREPAVLERFPDFSPLTAIAVSE